MFNIFFPNKVAHRLFRMGYKPEQMPRNDVFSDICYSLKLHGYNADDAAKLWNDVFNENLDACYKMREDGGSYAKALMEPFIEVAKQRSDQQ